SPDIAGIPSGLLTALLFAGELPFLGIAFYLRQRYRSKGHLLEPLFEGKTLTAIPIGIGSGILMAGIGVVHATLAEKFFGKASTQAMEEIMRSLFQMKGRPLAVAALVFTIAIMATLCEEFFFRGAIFSS